MKNAGCQIAYQVCASLYLKWIGNLTIFKMVRIEKRTWRKYTKILIGGLILC